MNFKTYRLGFLIFFIFFITHIKSQNSDKKNFPTPTGIKNMLFYIQRTLNTNTIVYELNVDDKGELIEKEPIKLYYINYANKGEVEAVSSIQKSQAYGFKIKLIDADKKMYSFTLNSFKDRQLYLIKNANDKKFYVFCNIKNKLSILNNVFVKMETNFVGYPKVKSIELIGKTTDKNEEIVESFIP